MGVFSSYSGCPLLVIPGGAKESACFRCPAAEAQLSTGVFATLYGTFRAFRGIAKPRRARWKAWEAYSAPVNNCRRDLSGSDFACAACI